MANSKNNNEHFYFTPYGGMPDGKGDGIGANSSVITYKNGDKVTRIMMDFGVKLPTDEMAAKFPGACGIMPDFTLFFDTKDHKAPYPVDAILLTHAHADHIDGLIPVFLKAKQDGMTIPPIYGSRNTLTTLIDNLKEMNLNVGSYSFNGIKPTKDYSINEVKPFKEIQIGSLTVVPFPVPHTTAEAYGFIVHKDRKNALINPGDHRSLASHASFSGNNGLLAAVLRKIETSLLLADSTSTGIKRDPKTEITLQTALDSLQKIFDDNKGKQIFTPIISRATENLLPFLIKAKENGKKVFLDGYRLRKAFRRWQNLNVYYYRDDKGQLVECRNKKQLNELRKKGVDLYCAEDFRDTVFGFDDVTKVKAESFLAKTPKGQRLVAMSGAFAERSDTESSGAVRLVEGDHMFFSLNEESVFIMAQRAIKGLHHEEVIAMANMAASRRAKVYANTFGEYLGNFVVYMPLQPSGHDNADSAGEFMIFVMESSKNADDFGEKHKFYVLGIHGGKDYRETTANIAQKDSRMQGFVPSNYGTYEYEPGKVTEVAKTPLENQRFYVIINVPHSGQLVLSELDGFYEKTGAEDKVIPLDSRVGEVVRTAEDKIREKALEQEEISARRQSNKQRRAEENQSKYGQKHGSVRKAKKGQNKSFDKEINKNQQNKSNARKIKEYTGR